ncbi:MAG: prevent-host-death protein [Crocosphaera sp.]|nr:prevent-host-death protein [Crocosphaera sp.]
MSWVKGIKKGQIIELLTELDVPDGQEVLINIEKLDTLSSEKMRPSGLCEGEFIVPDDFDAPLPEDVLKSFEGV